MEVLIRHAGGENFSKRIRFAPCLFVGSEYTFILFWQAFSCSHQFFICPYFPLHSHCCQLIHNFLYTQYININKSIFATKRLSVNNSGTLCQGENCLITIFNLVIYYCYTATNFLFTCIIISLSRLFQKISLLYMYLFRPVLLLFIIRNWSYIRKSRASRQLALCKLPTC